MLIFRMKSLIFGAFVRGMTLIVTPEIRKNVETTITVPFFAPSNNAQPALKTMTMEEFVTLAMTDTALTGFPTATLYQLYDDAIRVIKSLHNGTRLRVYVDPLSIINLAKKLEKTIRLRDAALSN
jgi:hypothetical protein